MLVSAQMNELGAEQNVEPTANESLLSSLEQSLTILPVENSTEAELLTTPEQLTQDTDEQELPLTPVCLSHFNGYEYCVDRATRQVSASNITDGVWWEFELPGENSTNSIVEVLAIENQLALIADRTPSAVPFSTLPSNDHYELSLFSLEGSFIDTRSLLQIPETIDFVAICSEQSLDECTPSLATHKLTRNEFWLYQHELPLVDTMSNTAINADNYELLITDLSYFWNSDHFGYPYQVLKRFYESVGDQLVDSQMTLEDIPDGWLDKYANTTDSEFYELQLCPDGGSIVKFTYNPVVTLYRQCKHLDWVVDGQRSSKWGHRTSDLHYTDFTVMSDEEEASINGGFSNTFGGLGGSSSKRTASFVRQTETRRTVVNSHSTSNSYRSSRGDDFHNGAEAVLDDGRTGQYFDRADSYSRTSVGYSLIDSAFSNSRIRVSAYRNRVSEGTSIKLSDGIYLSEPQEVLIIFNHPSGEEQQFRQDYSGLTPSHFNDGSATFDAEDGSKLEILPNSDKRSPLATVSVYDSESETPMLTNYMDFRARPPQW